MMDRMPRRERGTADLFRLTMNKFLNKKKAPEGISSNAEAYHALSSPPHVSPGLKKSATSRWKRNKKPMELPKPEFNLSDALPASDDFRTSLLMPNLSARFSMLREQDDPNSLLGKASDDSVLQPRRRSRLMDFGFSNGLNDIAEVQSIRSSIRPPFASINRGSSYGSEEGYGSDIESRNGSVMSRARPGEGNNLFGGRQKVYKIGTTGGTSKAVYEDDIGMSAFQRYRKEREAADNWRAEVDPSFDFGLDRTDGGFHEDSSHHAPMPNDSAKDLSDSAKDLTHSPSLSSYDKKRSTTSSTAHSEARSSTAATSVASQNAAAAPAPLVAASQAPAPTPATSAPAMKRSDTQKRRLYEQGLDQHIQEQQVSALSRLQSLHRQRALNHANSQPLLYSAKSATNLSELKAQQPVYALRAQSPPPMAPLTTFGSMRKPNSANASPMTSGPQSPVSPQMTEFPELSSALEPGDRGKATAMGAFNKPQQQFDEQQYLERQQQLQRAASKHSIRKDLNAQSAFHQRFARFEQDKVPELPGERERSASNASAKQRIGRAADQVPRSRSGSKASARSRSRSQTKHETTKAYNVFQNAANAMGARLGAQQYDTHQTFFGNISASDSEEEEDERQLQHASHSGFGYGSQSGRWTPAPLPPVSEHPALRGHGSKPSLVEEDEDEYDQSAIQPERLKPSDSSLSLRTDVANAMGGAMKAIDSPTLGPSTSEPLNGLVHHLRQESNQSSVYPVDETSVLDEVADMPEPNCNTRESGRQSTQTSEPRAESTYTNSNPWDLDDLDNPYSTAANLSSTPISPIDGYQRGSQFSGRAPSRTAPRTDRQSEAYRQSEASRQSEVYQDSEAAPAAPWQRELQSQHTRDASTATQAEREAFANELAARREAIQEKMRRNADLEAHSRATSPAPSVGGAFKAFGMLRSKSSRDSINMGKEGPGPSSKAMKMLGIGPGTGSSTNLNSQYERGGFSFEASRPRGNSTSRTPPMPAALARSQMNDYELREEDEAGRVYGLATRKMSSDQMRSNRSRSNSEATTGRSRSRTGPYRDDLEKAMIEGTGSSVAGLPNLSPMLTQEPTPRPSPEASQSPFDTGKRARSNSRPAPPMNGYFEPKSMLPNQTGTAPSSRLPTAAFNSAPGPARNTPAASPMTQMPTPPVSGANTPSAPSFTTPPNMTIIQPRQGVLKKRAVSKADISEPTLLSSTSNIDTVELPEGASLKNGMDEVAQPPPVPPINPKRRGTRKLFGLGSRSGSDPSQGAGYGNYGRSKTPDPWVARNDPSEWTEGLLRSPPGKRPGMGYGDHSSPAITQVGTTSPTRVERGPVPMTHGGIEGGMF